VDQNNVPFLLACDIAQAMLNRLKIKDVRYYLDERKAQGYNAFWFIIATPNAWTTDSASSGVYNVGPQNAYGVFPFNNSSNNLSSPDDKYFSYVRQIVDEAASRGMMVGISPAYVGFSGGDMLPLMKNSGPRGCKSYGEFLGNYFKDRSNIFWIHQGDNNAYNFGGTSSQALVDAVVDGITSMDTIFFRIHTTITRTVSTRLRTSSYKGQFDNDGFKTCPTPWLNVNNLYVFTGASYEKNLQENIDARSLYINTSIKLPHISIDGVCEHYNDDARANRAQGYYAILTGASGFMTGNIRICWFMSPDTYPPSLLNWKTDIKDKETISATYINKLIIPRQWWKLIPDLDHQVLTKGYDLCAAAKTSDSLTAIIYMPTRRTIIVNLAQLTGISAKASWYSPRTGEYEFIGIYSRTSTPFTPPYKNADDNDDWVLVLESNILTSMHQIKMEDRDLTSDWFDDQLIATRIRHPIVLTGITMLQTKDDVISFNGLRGLITETGGTNLLTFCSRT
jgi:hypothetical protein